jgi:hypothetical protein
VEEFLSPAGLPDDELRALLSRLEREERELSTTRRAFHERIDLLRAELVRRLRDGLAGLGSALTGDHVLRSRPLFAGTADEPCDTPPPLPPVGGLSDVDLRTLIRTLEGTEDDVSLRRRVLHVRIDMLRAEIERRG